MSCNTFNPKNLNLPKYSFQNLSIEIYHPSKNSILIVTFGFDIFNYNDSLRINILTTDLTSFFSDGDEKSDQANSTFQQKVQGLNIRTFKTVREAVLATERYILEENFISIISWKRNQFDINYLNNLINGVSEDNSNSRKFTDRDYIFYYAKRLILSEERFTSYSYFMANMVGNKKRKIMVPKINNLYETYNKNIYNILQYFLIKMHHYSKNSLDEMARRLELAALCEAQIVQCQGRGMYTVEGCLFRNILRADFVPYEKSVKHVSEQDSTRSLPCVMEPKSGLYTDPVGILDFQSLYPSIVTAFQFDYGTYLGSRRTLKGFFDKMDAKFKDLSDDAENFITFSYEGPNKNNTQFEVGQDTLLHLLTNCDHLQVIETQNLTNFHTSVFILDKTNAFIRTMYSKYLKERFIIKKKLKIAKKAKFDYLTRILDSRQHARKLVCNVAYGFTSANLSGRMPNPGIADAIVGTGRATLENMINMIDSDVHQKFEVVYGDTDSMFIRIKPKVTSINQYLFPSPKLIFNQKLTKAFILMVKLVQEINQQMVPPIKIKFEKIYLPCILNTKKRYMGKIYENMSEVIKNWEDVPIEYKGTEVIRRDNTLGTARVLDELINLFFKDSLGLINDEQEFKTAIFELFSHARNGFFDLRNFAIPVKVTGALPIEMLEQTAFATKIHKGPDQNLNFYEFIYTLPNKPQNKGGLYQPANYQPEFDEKNHPINHEPPKAVEFEKILNIERFLDLANDKIWQKIPRDKILSYGRQPLFVNVNCTRRNEIDNNFNRPVLKINSRLLTASQLIKRRRRPNYNPFGRAVPKLTECEDLNISLDSSYYFWKQIYPAIYRSLGHDELFQFMIDSKKLLSDDQLEMSDLEDTVINQLCFQTCGSKWSDKNGNLRNCVNLHCSVNYKI